jgi:DNA (cytosine-5)-methyltransferase 1
MTAIYNEIDSYVAQWLRNLIAGGHIAPGAVDYRPRGEAARLR